MLIGAGKLGRALLGYVGLCRIRPQYRRRLRRQRYASSAPPRAASPSCICRGSARSASRDKIKIGIITVPAEQAQGVCDLLISNGILAIWNFAPKHLNVPDHILVQNENMAASLALLCKHLNEQMKAAGMTRLSEVFS